MSYEENASISSINCLCPKPYEESHQFINLQPSEAHESGKDCQIKSTHDVSFLRESITSILPSLSEATLQSVIARLTDDIGVEIREDLYHVREGDFQGVLKPLPARKLIHSWKEGSYTCMTQCTTLDSLNTPVESYRLVPVTEADLTQINVSPPTVTTFSAIPQKRQPENSISVPYIVTVGNSEVNLLGTTEPPPSQSSSSSITYSEPQLRDKNWIKTYSLPWNKVRGNLLDSLAKNMPLEVKAKRELIRLIAEDIFSINKKPLPGDLMTIVKQMSEVYPVITNSNDNGELDGIENIFVRLRNRINFLRKKEVIINKHLGLSEDWIQLFVIPWEKMPARIRRSLENGIKLERNVKRELVRVVADDIIRLTYEPKAKHLRSLAQQMVDVYPDSLSDRENDAPNGKSNNLYKTLVFRMHYLIKKQRKSHYGSAEDVDVKSEKQTSVESPPIHI